MNSLTHKSHGPLPVKNDKPNNTHSPTSQHITSQRKPFRLSYLLSSLSLYSITHAKLAQPPRPSPNDKPVQPVQSSISHLVSPVFNTCHCSPAPNPNHNHDLDQTSPEIYIHHIHWYGVHAEVHTDMHTYTPCKTTALCTIRGCLHPSSLPPSRVLVIFLSCMVGNDVSCIDGPCFRGFDTNGNETHHMGNGTEVPPPAT